MKRLINGVRMLKDIESKKVSLAEQMAYLFIVIGPGLSFFNSESDKDLIKENVYVTLGIFALSICCFYLLSKKSREHEKAIERYICLTVPAIITSYVFLIPLSLLLEAIFRKQIPKENLETFFNYFLIFYMPLYVPASLFLWKRDKDKVNNDF